MTEYPARAALLDAAAELDRRADMILEPDDADYTAGRESGLREASDLLRERAAS